MKHIYEQPELNKMEYAVSDVISTSGGDGYDSGAEITARDNDVALLW